MPLWKTKEKKKREAEKERGRESGEGRKKLSIQIREICAVRGFIRTRVLYMVTERGPSLCKRIERASRLLWEAGTGTAKDNEA